MAQKLETYLRTYRKRSGLTQDELATLSGCKSGVSICEYERLKGQPSLETALACQAIFGVSVEELFPGIYQKVAKDVASRSERLSKHVPQGGSLRGAKLKRGLFKDITRRLSDHNHNNVWRTTIEKSPAS